MFQGGSVWKPPSVNPYLEGFSTDEEEDLPLHGEFDPNRNLGPHKKAEEAKEEKVEMATEDRDQLEDMLRSLTPRQKQVGDLMVFCMDHSNHAEEIVECIVESCCILETPLTKKIARVYLISDILHNSSAKVAKASFFRKHFESKLEQVMVALHKCHKQIQSRMRSEQFKQKVLMCFRVWDDWAVYPDKYLIHLQNTFLGLVKIFGDDESEIDGIPTTAATDDESANPVAMDDRFDDSVDGVPLDNDVTLEDDVDGIPLDSANQQPAKEQPPQQEPPRFIQSKWETVDKEVVEQQAMTTSKWELLNNEEDDEDVDGVEIEETEIEQPPPKKAAAPESSKLNQSMEYDAGARARLREVEVKVMRLQDDIEAGKKKLREGETMQQALKEYREKLLERDAEKEAKKKGRDKDKKEKDRKRKRSRSSSSEGRKKKNKKDHKKGLVAYNTDSSSEDERKKKKSSSSRKRSRSRSRHRHKSRSPRRGHKRSRSRDRNKKSKKSKY